MFKISDRVKETTSTAGTGSITLSGSVGAFQTFLQGVGDGNTTYYTIENGANFEIGQGTLSSNVLSRAFVEHPNSGIKVDGSSSFLDSVNIKSLSVSGIVNSGQSISMLDSVVLGNTNSNSITTNSILTSGANTILGGSNIVGSLNVGGNALVSGSLSSAGGGDLIVDSVQVSDAVLSSGLLTLKRSGAGNFFHAY